MGVLLDVEVVVPDRVGLGRFLAGVDRVVIVEVGKDACERPAQDRRVRG